PLSQVLDRLIEREHHAAPGRRWREDLLRRDLATERVTAHDGAARRAGEGLVPRALDTLQAAVHALEAEHVRRELTVGIQAQRLGEEAEPRLVQRTHARGDRRRPLATEPHEAFAGCELRIQVARGDLDER